MGIFFGRNFADKSVCIYDISFRVSNCFSASFIHKSSCKCQVVLSASPTPVSTSIPAVVPQIVMQETNTPYPSPEPAQSAPASNVSSDNSNDCSGVNVTIVHTPKGDTLHIERCADQWIYEFPAHRQRNVST